MRLPGPFAIQILRGCRRTARRVERMLHDVVMVGLLHQVRGFERWLLLLLLLLLLLRRIRVGEI